MPITHDVVVKAINDKGEVIDEERYVCTEQDIFLVEDFVRNIPKAAVRVVVDVALSPNRK